MLDVKTESDALSDGTNEKVYDLSPSTHTSISIVTGMKVSSRDIIDYILCFLPVKYDNFTPLRRKKSRLPVA